MPPGWSYSTDEFTLEREFSRCIPYGLECGVIESLFMEPPCGDDTPFICTGLITRGPTGGFFEEKPTGLMTRCGVGAVLCLDCERENVVTSSSRIGLIDVELRLNVLDLLPLRDGR